MTVKNRKHSTGELALFAAFDAQQNDLPKTEGRTLAYAWLKDNGIATKRVESYHYSDLRSQFSKAQSYGAAKANVSLADIKAHPTIAAFDEAEYQSIIFVDGQLRQDLSDLGSSLIDNQSAWIAENLAQADNQNHVDNLTRAMWHDGICLALHKSSDKPIHLIFANSGQSDITHFNRHYIELAANVSATLIESHINLDDSPSFNLHHFKFKLNKAAKLTHFVVNGENKKAVNICRTDGDYADNVELNSSLLSIGGAWTRREGDLYCNGSNMDLKVSGAVLAGGEQHVDNTYIVHHTLPENISFQRFKNVIDDKAHAIFQGKVIVAIDAQKTDGQQMSQSILLSDDAAISTKPELEIYADDVECAHGATVGALDAEMLFYLRARGIPKKVAQKLLIHAFIAEISDDLPEALNIAADKLITVWLNAHLEA